MQKSSDICPKDLHTVKRKAVRKPKTPAYPYRDLYSKILESKLGEQWVAELPFHPKRKWRFDYACPDKKIAIEVDGGIWNEARGLHGGRHSGGMGQLKDMEKLNAAAAMGWLVFRITPQQKMDTGTLMMIYNAIKLRKSTTL